MIFRYIEKFDKISNTNQQLIATTVTGGNGVVLGVKNAEQISGGRYLGKKIFRKVTNHRWGEKLLRHQKRTIHTTAF